MLVGRVLGKHALKPVLTPGRARFLSSKIHIDDPNPPAPHLLLSTRDRVAGRAIQQELGVVTASVVQSKSLVHDLVSALGGMFGGESAFYSHLIDDTMYQAVRRVEEAAKAKGATGVVRVRFAITTTMNRLIFGLHCSVTCYGTAVRCGPKQK